MYLKKVEGPRAIKLPNGRVISMADLPPETTRRWVASRKELVVLAVRFGLIGENSALDRYNLTKEEFQMWCNSLDRYGHNGLKATKIQVARQPKVEYVKP